MQDAHWAVALILLNSDKCGWFSRRVRRLPPSLPSTAAQHYDSKLTLWARGVAW